jgi:uncharacterized protein (TIGR02118 family)
MHKLLILIETPSDPLAFDRAWPQFLKVAESMPGLRRETSSHVDQRLYGHADYALIHELYFDNLESLTQAMAAPQGSEAGRLLQTLTGGHMTLLITDHKEDELTNIQKYHAEEVSHDADVDLN